MRHSIHQKNIKSFHYMVLAPSSTTRTLLNRTLALQKYQLSLQDTGPRTLEWCMISAFIDITQRGGHLDSLLGISIVRIWIMSQDSHQLAPHRRDAQSQWSWSRAQITWYVCLKLWSPVPNAFSRRWPIALEVTAIGFLHESSCRLFNHAMLAYTMQDSLKRSIDDLGMCLLCLYICFPLSPSHPAWPTYRSNLDTLLVANVPSVLKFPFTIWFWQITVLSAPALFASAIADGR